MCRTNTSLVQLSQPSIDQGRQTGGGGGWGGLNPPWILDGGVERLSTPPDFEKKFLGEVGSP